MVSFAGTSGATAAAAGYDDNDLLVPLDVAPSTATSANSTSAVAKKGAKRKRDVALAQLQLISLKTEDGGAPAVVVPEPPAPPEPPKHQCTICQQPHADQRALQ